MSFFVYKTNIKEKIFMFFLKSLFKNDKIVSLKS